ncbi:hypothetical protein K431DRAFT_316129 [Polychaeton citri CBS 116435]|uniref:Uncharacterized protein n=1 Tax=Polychaeton citri CBS 116435 TaxID=1314669 RepID=A0A9P4UL61_9PEZI|nr:hypothetical protein K431DRAFT_316129 [Polychaeton citri CBS 116435]
MSEIVDNGNAQKRAPLRNSDLLPQTIVPDEYFVYLEPGYTLAEHKRTVGAGVLPEGSIKQVNNLLSNRDSVYYIAYLSKGSLDTVRLDPGVQLVERNIVGYVDDD